MSTYAAYRVKSKLSDILNKKQNHTTIEKKKESRVIPYDPFVPPSIPTEQKNSQGLLQLYQTIPGVTLVDSIRVDKIPKWGMTESEGILQTPFNQNQISGVDKLTISKIQNNLEHVDFVTQVMKDVNNQYYGNGSSVGLLRRVKKQMRKKPSSKITSMEWDYVKSIFPKKNTAILRSDSIVSLDPELNMEAHPGAPFFVTGVTIEDVINTCIEKSQEYFKDISDLGAKKFFIDMYTQDRIAEFVTILARKKDIYEREEYLEKVRPFGVVPGSLRILFTCVTDPAFLQLHNFLTHPDSFSAWGFSWTHGGVNKLVEWIKSYKEPGFYPLSWGDDQLWKIVCEDGTVILYCPDVSGMDMKLDTNTFNLAQLVLMHLYSDAPLNIHMLTKIKQLKEWVDHPDTKISASWFQVLQLLVTYATTKPVLSVKAIVAAQSVGLLSGMNGTSFFDFVASARICHLVQSIDIPKDVSEVPQYIQDISQACNEAGFPLKEETQIYQDLTNNIIYDNEGKQQETMKDNQVIGLPFLGMKVFKYTVEGIYFKDDKSRDILVPQMDSKKAMISQAFNVHDDKDPAIVQMKKQASTLGIGYHVAHDPIAHSILADIYNTRAKMGFPYQEEYDTDGFAENEGMGEHKRKLDKVLEYPPPIYFLSLFMDEHTESMLRPIHLAYTDDERTEKVKESSAFVPMFNTITYTESDEVNPVELGVSSSHTFVPPKTKLKPFAVPPNYKRRQEKQLAYLNKVAERLRQRKLDMSAFAAKFKGKGKKQFISIQEQEEYDEYSTFMEKYDREQELADEEIERFEREARMMDEAIERKLAAQESFDAYMHNFIAENTKSGFLWGDVSEDEDEWTDQDQAEMEEKYIYGKHGSTGNASKDEQAAAYDR
jgi:hypothetical protein